MPGGLVVETSQMMPPFRTLESPLLFLAAFALSKKEGWKVPLMPYVGIAAKTTARQALQWLRLALRCVRPEDVFERAKLLRAMGRAHLMLKQDVH